MPELIWCGKYNKDGKRNGPLRIALPFQTVEMVNEPAHEREWRNRLIWGEGWRQGRLDHESHETAPKTRKGWLRLSGAPEEVNPAFTARLSCFARIFRVFRGPKHPRLASALL